MVVYRLDTGGFLGGDTDCVLLLFIADHAPEVNDVYRQSISDSWLGNFKRMSGSSGLKVQAVIAC